MNLLRRYYHKIAPPLSIRRQFFDLLLVVSASFRQEGFVKASQQIVKAIQRYQRTGTLFVPEIKQPMPVPPMNVDSEQKRKKLERISSLLRGDLPYSQTGSLL